MTEEELKQIILQRIAQDHQLGDQSGGSGHLSFVTPAITDIQTSQTPDGSTNIAYSYTLETESEFSIAGEEDHMPPAQVHRKTITITSSEEKE